MFATVYSLANSFLFILLGGMVLEFELGSTGIGRQAFYQVESRPQPFFALVIFQIEFCVFAMAGLKLISCLLLCTPGITGMHHHTLLAS
jgi:hypothetical protein